MERQTSRDDNNNVKLTTLKNSSSYRTIGLEDDLLKELKKFKARQNELILGSKTFRQNEDQIIFQNYLGNYLTPSTIRESIQEYCEKTGVEYKGTLRHTHAVLLLESGASLVYVSKRLGHKTIKTTADIYLSITEKIEEDELKKFASYTKRTI
ncbi:tyrosine-type recombinase/integrase [Brevibacillus formosus]|uniref:tyrosine-type recombinase/integrase n=1 Tax=Brevibacillus formosus TaxID=54913 RepID=UPI003B968DA6